MGRKPAYSSEEEDYSGSEEELSEEVRERCCRKRVAAASLPAAACARRPGSRGHTAAPPTRDTQELAAAMAMQRQRGGAAATAGGGSDEEEDEEEGDGEEEGAAPQRRPAIYNVEVLHDKLEDVGWSEEAAWDETLALTAAEPTAVGNPEDDLERELAFYNQVRCSVEETTGGRWACWLRLRLRQHCVFWAVNTPCDGFCLSMLRRPHASSPCRLRRRWAPPRPPSSALSRLASRGSAPPTIMQRWWVGVC